MSPVNRAHTRLDQLRFPDVVQISTLDGLQYTIQLLHAIRQNCPETRGFFLFYGGKLPLSQRVIQVMLRLWTRPGSRDITCPLASACCLGWAIYLQL